jgi:hypothetical protein
MPVKVKKSNMRRLASLSALGAGALGVAAGTAEAGTPDAGGMVWSGVVDEKVGFAASYGIQATIGGPNGAAAVFVKMAYSFTTIGIGGPRRLRRTPNNQTVCIDGQIGCEQTLVARGASHQPDGTVLGFLGSLRGFASAFGRGAKFGTRTHGGVHSGVAIAGIYSNPSERFVQTTHFSSTDRYLLFKFSGGKLTHPVYGWAELHVTFPGGRSGPDVVLVSYAYDTSGAQIPAGYRGKAMDGDEGTFERAGLSALSLGAAGVRSWRAARQAEASH